MPFNIDSDIRNADCAKRTWDIHGDPGDQADFVLHFRDGSPIEALTSFLALPVASAMPADVRDELRRRGYSVPEPGSDIDPGSVGVPIENDPDDLRGRFRATLLAGAIGDALGRPAEGGRHPRFVPPWRYTDYTKWRGYRSGPIGTITDDTQLTIVVAECLLSNGLLDPSNLADRLVQWLPTGRGKGKATTAAVERLQAGVPWYLAGEDSAGNGSAMRAAPVGLLHFRHPVRLRVDATLSSLPTHRNPMAVAGATAMAAATAWLVGQKAHAWVPADFIAAIQSAIAGLEPTPQPERANAAHAVTLHDRIGEIPMLLEKPPDQVLAYLYNGAYVLESLPAALYFFLCTPYDIEQILHRAVNAEYDADTVAAMAGTLGGALGGETALPQRLLRELEYRDRLIELADGLFRQAGMSK